MSTGSTATAKTVRLALLVAVGLALFVVEQSIPRPVPWLRLGLANSATLLALCLFGPKEALLVAALRSIIGSVFVGGLLNPAFLFSLGGGLVSAAWMGLVRSISRGMFSVIGISIWGALAHNCAQLLLAMIIFIRHPGLLYLLPYLILSAVGTGWLTGLLVHLLLQPLTRGWDVSLPRP